MFVNELFSKKKPEPAKPRNFVAKNAKMGGAGAHKDKKKADKQGDVKHKKDLAGDLAESNRGYEPGFASSSAPALGDKAGFKRAELQHELGHEQNNIAIAINGKTWKVIPGRGYADSKEEWSYLNNMKDWAAKKSASSGKKWSVHLTGAPVTVDEAKLPTKDKENRFKAIHQRDQQQDQLTSQAMNNINDTNEGQGDKLDELSKDTLKSYVPKRIEKTRGLGNTNYDKAHRIVNKDLPRAMKKLKDPGYNKLDEFAPPGGDDGNDGFSDETLKRLAAQWYNGDEDPRVEKTLMAAGWEIGQDEGYDDEPGVFVVQAGDVNGDSYMSWPADELRQGMAEGGLEANTPDPVVVIQDLKGKILDKVNLSMAAQKYKLGNPQDIKKQLAHQNYTTIGNYVVVAPMSGQPQDATTQGMAEGSELKQAKRKYNQAAKDANTDQVGAGKKIDTMKKSLRQKDLAKQGFAEGTLDEAVGMIIKGAAISGPDDQDIADRIAARTGGRVASGSYGHHILITYPTPQDRAIAAKKIRKMFPGIELYKSAGNRNAIDEQGMAEGKKKADTYHIVNKDGKPANLASYADKESAVKDRDAKHQGAEVRQLGPRGKVKGVSEVAPPGAKAERMVKHIKKGYAKDGKLSDKERSIAYATAWKAHNKEINEEIEIRIIEMRMNGYEL
jgi:hypothetical protein